MEGVLPHFWVTGENGKEAKKKKNKIPTAANTLYFFYFYLLTLEMVCLDCLYMLDLSRHFFFFSSGAAIIRCVWRKEPSARVYHETSEMSVLTGAIYSFFVVVFVCGPFQFFFKQLKCSPNWSFLRQFQQCKWNPSASSAARCWFVFLHRNK